MNKKNILILIFITLIVLLVVVLALIKNLNVNNYTPEYKPEINNTVNKTLNNISNRSNYYIVETCINKFFIYYSLIYEAEEDVSTEEIYNMLDSEYIEYSDLTQDNIVDKLKGISSSKVNITKMYTCEQTENLSIYFVYGTLRDKKTSDISEFSMMVRLDKYNKTFSIFLQDYIDEKYGDIKVGENIEISDSEEIEKNDDNMYTYEAIDDETYITDVFNNFRDNMIYNKQIAYECLEEEYRTKRLPTFEDFETYIQNNTRKILAMKLSRYQKNQDENGVQYICIDTNDNYYVINETSTMNCTFILDTYTIDLPEFLEKYETSDDNTKVALNIEKIREAINVKDYKYVYNKTDETFRNNNFKSYNDFENYLEENLFNQNSFEYKNIEKQANVYVATVVVKNKKNANEESKEIKIFMKLTDTTDYYISFNFDD